MQVNGEKSVPGPIPKHHHWSALGDAYAQCGQGLSMWDFNTCYLMSILVSILTAVKTHIVFVTLALLSDQNLLLLQVLISVSIFTLLANCLNCFVITWTVKISLWLKWTSMVFEHDCCFCMHYDFDYVQMFWIRDCPQFTRNCKSQQQPG